MNSTRLHADLIAGGLLGWSLSAHLADRDLSRAIKRSSSSPFPSPISASAPLPPSSPEPPTASACFLSKQPFAFCEHLPIVLSEKLRFARGLHRRGAERCCRSSR